MKKLWNDLQKDQERIEFLKSGRAEETGIIATAMVPEIISLFEQRLETGQVNAVVMGLLRELAVRSNVVFPVSPKELKWFEEGTEKSGDFDKRLDSVFSDSILLPETP